MKSKAWIILILFLGSLGAVAFGGERWMAKFTAKAVDEDGKPIQGMDIFAGLGGEDKLRGVTDTNGCFVVESTNVITREGGLFAKAAGYYETHVKCDFPTVVDGRCQPWNPVVTAVVRRVVNPIAMHAKMVETTMPSTNSPCGYDLMVGDWVAPLGKGLFSDLLFTLEGYWKDFRNNDSTLTLSFSNSKDGFIAVDFPMDHGRPYGSKFFMRRTAPEDGFQFELKLRRCRTPGEGKSRDMIVDDIREGRGYIFRIRSVTNETGIVTNALYGKVSTDFNFGGAGTKGCFLKFTYYLNPTPNDRNLEFDPKRNLFTNLKSTEQVTAP